MSFLNRLNPTPAFPAYTGPYKVGSVDVEIPTSELDSPGPSPSPCTNLPTVAFRIFYPCRQGSEQRGVRWIPSPQREVVGAYARFLGAGSAFASMFSLVPQLLYYINIPVHNNADVLEPTTTNGRWPVVIFSHGLGGSRNAYSHICGSLASHGLVVVAPDHRDGSAPISFMHSPDEKGKLRRVEYTRIAHTPSPEVYEARDEQLRVRLWELGLIHDALLKIDQRVQLTNVAEDQKRNGGKDMLTMFSHTLNVHEPGAITFAGHSFGAATTVQFLKSVYYRPTKDATDFRPLFTPSPTSNISKQITPETPTILLDLWCLPLQSPATAYLKSKPLPCYDSPTGGSNLLAILSEAFFKWTVHLKETKRLIAKPNPTSSKYPSQPGPHFFYPISSAHLSQSDFGVLFQWATTKIFGAKEPERVLRLNTRAILQVLRGAGIQVAKTSFRDLEMGEKGGETTERGLSQDTKILSRTRESVRGWVCLGTDVWGESEERIEGGPEDAVVEGEVLGEVVDRKERQHL